MTWKRKRLIDLFEIIGGGTPKTTIPEYWNGNIPWLSVKDFNNSDRYVYKTEKTITNSGLKNSSTKLLEKDDIIISARGTVGELAMIPYPMAFNQSCYGIRGNEEVDKTFLYYLLKNSITNLKNISHGSVFDTITRETFSNITVDIPDKDYQRKIAKFLSNLDNKIELNKRINDNLEKQAKTIFEKCFPDINNGSDIIGKVIVPKRGKTLLSKNALLGDIPVIAGGIEPTIYHNIANTIPPVITISASGANAGYVNLWNRPVWSSDSSFIDLSMTKNVYFWYILLKNKQKEIFESQTGSAQPHIYPKHIAELKVNIPSKKSIQEFSLIITPFFEHISKNLFENDKLSNIRNAILPKLISGNIDISNI